MKISPVKYHCFLTCLLLTTAGATSCKNDKKEASKAAAAAKPSSVSADAYVVAPQQYARTYTTSGSILPNEAISLMPEVSGRVTAILFREGAAVRKGQTLVQLYDADLQANVDKLRAQRQLQKTTESRQAELVRIGGIARQDYDATRTNIQAIDADIEAAQAGIRRMKIVAPFDGTVGIRQISTGAVITPSTIITTLQQTYQLKIDFTVPDQYRSQISNGQRIFFTVDGMLDTMQATVAAIDPGADPATRTLKLRATVPNNAGKLTAGSFAHVIIPFGSAQSAILIPSQAIIPTTRDKKVARLRGGKAELITVQTGDRTADRIEILNGLQQGDTVLTTGLMQVKPGMAVKVRAVVR